eukprot:761307-Alexandrium_andersonii.AAC.1
MSASLVGSEMCIRDRFPATGSRARWSTSTRITCAEPGTSTLGKRAPAATRGSSAMRGAGRRSRGA